MREYFADVEKKQMKSVLSFKRAWAKTNLQDKKVKFEHDKTHWRQHIYLENTK